MYVIIEENGRNKVVKKYADKNTIFCSLFLVMMPEGTKVIFFCIRAFIFTYPESFFFHRCQFSYVYTQPQSNNLISLARRFVSQF